MSSTATRSPVAADIVIPSWGVVVEFDGRWSHSFPGSAAADRAQTEALNEAGWLVLRVREDLEPFGNLDVVVATTWSERDIAAAVIEQLARLGHHAVHLTRYLNDNQPWATAAADTEIRRTLRYSVASTRPDLAAEWHPIHNGDLRPEQTHPGSNSRV